MKKAVCFLLAALVFCSLPSLAQLKVGENKKESHRLVGAIAVAPVVYLPTNKMVPVLIQVEGVGGEAVPPQAYISSSKGSFGDTEKSQVKVDLINGYARVLLNLQKISQIGGSSRISLYSDQEQKNLISFVDFEVKQQEAIHLLSVEAASATKDNNEDGNKWDVAADGKTEATVKFRIEDAEGKGLAGVPYLLRKTKTWGDDDEAQFSAGSTDAMGLVVIKVPARSQEGMVIYQVVTEYLNSIQAVLKFKAK